MSRILTAAELSILFCARNFYPPGDSGPEFYVVFSSIRWGEFFF